MEVFKDLFNDGAGLLILTVILITVLIPVYFFYMFVHKSGTKE